MPKTFRCILLRKKKKKNKFYRYYYFYFPNVKTEALGM